MARPAEEAMPEAAKGSGTPAAAGEGSTSDLRAVSAFEDPPAQVQAIDGTSRFSRCSPVDCSSEHHRRTATVSAPPWGRAPIV